MDVLTVPDVSFRYGSHRVLDRVNMSVAAGEFACITGANGSGKSTLLKLILGKLLLQQGSIQMLQQELSSFREWTKIGYIPQSLSTLTSGFPATAQEIVATGLYGQIGPLRFPNRRHKQAVLEALTALGMQDYVNQPIGTLSGGQQQRVMLAKVLVAKPALMLLDEPSAGVDPASADSSYKLIATLCREQGLTAVMVTHDEQRCLHYADRVFCIEHANLAELPKSQLAHELSHRHRHSPHADCVEPDGCEPSKPCPHHHSEGGGTDA